MTNEMDKPMNPEVFPETATEWLQKWDNDELVWSIEMGGIGPSYEQCIQIAAAEYLRFMIAEKTDLSDSGYEENFRAIEEYRNDVITSLGITGAQFGAAVNLAYQFYRRGPRASMSDEAVKDRHIQIRKSFP
jgi:hypothetical protein